MSTLTHRPVDPHGDAELLHSWVTHAKSRFWQMSQASVDDVVEAYATIDANPHHGAFLGLDGATPTFLFEVYDPAHDPIGSAYPVQPGDVGMHVLIAPTDTPVPGYTRTVFAQVMRWVFADRDAARVVVEPDVNNTRIHALNAWAGFIVDGPVNLPDKTALLSFCSRVDFDESEACEGEVA